jgi:hypothetical protein
MIGMIGLIDEGWTQYICTMKGHVDTLSSGGGGLRPLWMTAVAILITSLINILITY